MIAFLSPPSPIVRLAGDGYVPVDVRDGEHIGLFASPIVRLAGDGYVPQLGGMTHCNYAKVLGSSSDEPATKNIVQEKNQTIGSDDLQHGWKFSNRTIIKNFESTLSGAVTTKPKTGRQNTCELGQFGEI
ncbi:unnamed protein product [Rhizophagus irregularis]|nr:unnamed protein product [Rhizophagus irregularis]CAB4406120.1 unnamed protein product [Rhizophagus irregularis]